MKANCPAAVMEHGTLSLNKSDVRCNITGLLRDAKGSPCCDDYTTCPIWRVEKERVWSTGHVNRSEAAINSGTGTWERR